jgi:hypothetical protein
VSLFLSTSLCTLEDRLLPNDLIMITNYREDHGALGERLGDEQGHRGRSRQDGGPLRALGAVYTKFVVQVVFGLRF